jgi:hypothetical protein
MSNQVFILGAPRSGTTFLASLLEHTVYGKPFESQFIVKFYKSLSRYGDISQRANFKRLVANILKERAVQQWRLDIDLDEFYDRMEGDYSYAHITDSLLLLKNRQDGLEYWGDKTPQYIDNFDIIYELFPQARYIYIVRDGRDVALSLLEKGWGPNNIYACAKFWARLNRENARMDSLIESGEMLFLRYEDLVANPRGVTKSVYEFLSQPIDEESVESLSKSTKTDNFFKWKKKLSPRQIRVFDSIASRSLSRFGYEVACPESKLGILTRALYTLHDRFHYYMHMFELNVLDGIRIKFFGKEPFAD